MRLPFVFTLFLFTFTTNADDDTTYSEPKAETTPSPVVVQMNKLCLNINSLSITGVKFSNPQLKWAQPEGIFYVYNPSDSMDTFKSKRFPILGRQSTTTAPTDTLQTDEPSPVTFTFTGDESSLGCWMQPDFNQLNIRFKLYEFYHTALKAINNIAVANKTQSLAIPLNTLPYQYKDANVSVDITLEWSIDKIQLAPPIKPTKATIPPVKPPIMYYAQDDFNSDELTNVIITADEDVGEILPPMESEGTDWMFIAALCSSTLGLFVLVYICLWAYRTYGRGGYENIPNGGKVSKVSSRLGGIRKISLRNVINKNNEERIGIMHPSASYTFTE